MATIKLAPTRRARAAIAAVLLSAGAGGTLALMLGAAPVPDDVALSVTALVKPWEGRSLRAYLDTVAKPPVWTICDGDTKGVRPGMVETAAGCDRRLAGRPATRNRRHALNFGQWCPFYAPKSKRAVSPWPSPPR